MHRLIELFDKEIHVIATPVTTVFDTVRVLTILLIIRNHLSSCGIRIEIIIHMDAIDIIACHDILSHRTDIVAVLGDARIQDELLVIGEAALRMHHAHMIGSQHRGTLSLGAIRVDPRMQFHTTLVTLLYHPLQRIPIRRRCLALLSRQKTAPGLYTTLIECITLWSHLEDDGIYPILL